MVALVFTATGLVVTEMVALVCPAGIEKPFPTEAGPLAVTMTGRPPVGAGPLIVMVAVEDAPPMTVVGDRLTEVTVGAFPVGVREMPGPPYPAPKLTVVLAAAANVVMVAVTAC